MGELTLVEIELEEFETSLLCGRVAFTIEKIGQPTAVGLEHFGHMVLHVGEATGKDHQWHRRLLALSLVFQRMDIRSELLSTDDSITIGIHFSKDHASPVGCTLLAVFSDDTLDESRLSLLTQRQNDTHTHMVGLQDHIVQFLLVDLIVLILIKQIKAHYHEEYPLSQHQPRPPQCPLPLYVQLIFSSMLLAQRRHPKPTTNSL